MKQFAYNGKDSGSSSAFVVMNTHLSKGNYYLLDHPVNSDAFDADIWSLPEQVFLILVP